MITLLVTAFLLAAPEVLVVSSGADPVAVVLGDCEAKGRAVLVRVGTRTVPVDPAWTHVPCDLRRPDREETYWSSEKKRSPNAIRIYPMKVRELGPSLLVTMYGQGAKDEDYTERTYVLARLDGRPHRAWSAETERARDLVFSTLALHGEELFYEWERQSYDGVGEERFSRMRWDPTSKTLREEPASMWFVVMATARTAKEAIALEEKISLRCGRSYIVLDASHFSGLPSKFVVASSMDWEKAGAENEKEIVSECAPDARVVEARHKR